MHADAARSCWRGVGLVLMGLGLGGVLPRHAPPAATAPTRANEPPSLSKETQRALAALRDGERIDVNEADEAALRRVPGIGPTLARRIVAHRRRHGPFRRLTSLRNVRGIGARKLERMRRWLRVGATFSSSPRARREPSAHPSDASGSSGAGAGSGGGSRRREGGSGPSSLRSLRTSRSAIMRSR